MEGSIENKLFIFGFGFVRNNCESPRSVIFNMLLFFFKRFIKTLKVFSTRYDDGIESFLAISLKTGYFSDIFTYIYME